MLTNSSMLSNLSLSLSGFRHAQKEGAVQIGLTRQNAALNETGEVGAPRRWAESLVEPERLRR